MYSVRLYEDYKDHNGILIHSAYSSGEKLNSAKLKLKLKGIDEFSFSLSQKNVGFGKVRPLSSLISVFHEMTGEVIFSGRVLKPTYSMSSEGHFSQEYICESKTGYLYDSSQRYAELKNVYRSAYFSKIIEQHNRAVEPHKRFEIGQINLSNDEVKTRWTSYEKTYDVLRDSLLEKEGGYLRTRIEGSVTYLDYFDTPPIPSSTKLEIKRNLKSVSREIDMSSVATRVIPLGEALDVSDGEASPRLTIAALNEGRDYLDNTALQKEFGVIEETVIWEDAAGTKDLMDKAIAYVESQGVITEAWSVTALDLSLAGYDFNAIEVGGSYELVNPYIAPLEALQVIEKEVDLLSPISSSLTIGEKQKSLSQFQIDAKKVKSELIRLKGNVTSQKAKVTQLNDNLISVNESLAVVQKNLEDANLIEVSNQLQAIQLSLGQIEQNAVSKASFDLLKADLDTFKVSQEAFNNQVLNRLTNLEGGA
ncbi:phage tail protein [Listeria monocytogenes]|nr:phage tail protein [Listeria monocytogenes]